MMQPSYDLTHTTKTESRIEISKSELLNVLRVQGVPLPDEPSSVSIDTLYRIGGDDLIGMTWETNDEADPVNQDHVDGIPDLTDAPKNIGEGLV